MITLGVGFYLLSHGIKMEEIMEMENTMIIISIMDILYMLQQ